MTNSRELFIEISNQQVTEGDEVVGYLVKNSRMNELEKVLSAPAKPVIPEQPQRISDDDLIAVPRSVLACAGYAYGKAGLKDSNAYAQLRSYFFAPVITAQPVIPEQPEPTISFYRDGIIAAAKWVENQRDAYDNEHGQSDPDTGAFEFGNDAQLEYSTTLSEIAEGIRSLHPTSAQPVSGPYELPDGWVMVPQQIFLDASDIESICSQCGDGHKSGYGDFTDGLLWVGDIQCDNGTIMHGLHISSSDYQEEGGLTLAEFAAPAQQLS